ncbi:AraC family transcriptional regulator [Paenibacillus sambharensis]|uniref:AraC family transcriptional regulator n=1 Tax=Paenibacillus sambharensis TaxID=1803190 RepID=A0A2W1M1M8_9BACL|nr:AraC family transcriptional regulator [Paenibacillus sambharensis]PZD97557.1 AraC family transcriptional regulator [Paenibacillus sambharensis]
MRDLGVSVALLYPIMKTILRSGFDQEEFLRQARISGELLEDAEARLPEQDFERVTELAAAVTGDPLFGLHQGQRVEVSDLGILGYVMLHSGTVGQALKAYQTYNVIVCSGFNIDTEVQGDDLLITTSFQSNPLKKPGRHCMEDMVSSVYHLMMKLSCRTIALKELHFAHSEAVEVPLADYVSVLGVQPLFDRPASRMRVPKEVLEYPIVFGDAKLLRTFEAIAEGARQRLLQGRTFTDELYNWLLKLAPASLPGLKEAAQAFQMSARSLQARLQQEQTTYQDLMNQVRRELASGYLAKPEYTIAEIAYLLHFSEPSAFQNAFKRWTGLTPKQYRLASQQDRASAI